MTASNFQASLKLVLQSDIQRFMDKAIPEPNSGCWLWLGAVCKGNAGYGQMRWKGKTQSAHCVSFEIHKGEIPYGLDVCHTCDVPCCVNPEHLFSGTRSENMIDCVKKGRFENAARKSADRLRKTRFKHELKTCCPAGHLYSESNTYLHTDKNGVKRRICKVCRKTNKDRYNGRLQFSSVTQARPGI